MVLFYSFKCILCSLCKLLNSDGSKNKTNLSKTNNSRSSAPSFLKDDILIPIPSPDIYTTPSEPHIEDKRFKVKNRNKTKKETEKKNDKPVKQEIKVSNVVLCVADVIMQFLSIS